MPVTGWHELIGEPTIADSICDRLVHSAYVIELQGPSLRESRAKAAAQRGAAPGDDEPGGAAAARGASPRKRG